MSEDTSGSSSPPSHTSGVARQLAVVQLAIGIGLTLSAVGLVVGLTMAFRRREAGCANGTYFPEGTTDFRCFVHPHALDGTAVVVISLMLGILIGLTGAIARAVVKGGQLPAHA